MTVRASFVVILARRGKSFMPAYKNRIIIASGEFNQVTRQWKSLVCIFWKTDTQKLHSINDLPGIFETESEAVAFALKAGKGWIDTQPALKDLEGTKSPNERI